MDNDYREYLDGIKEWLDDTRDEQLESMGDFFDSRVDGYEEHMSNLKEYYKWLSDLIPEGTNKLLDLGCGTGLELDYIFKKNPGIQVTGVDLTKSMLDKLKEKHNKKDLNLICGDYFEVNLGEDCYDAAVSVESLHHFTLEKKAVLYKKIYDALKPGGIYIQCDYTAVNEEHEVMLYKEYLERRRKSNIPHGVFVHFDIPLTLEHEVQALKAGGFKEVKKLGALKEPQTQMIIAVK